MSKKWEGFPIRIMFDFYKAQLYFNYHIYLCIMRTHI